MAEADIPNTDTQVAEKLPFWRWLDDDYIAQGKVSGLAILEIIAAMAFYWFIANYFERPWVLVLTVCIAPVLLLRSEASIQFGIKLLKKSMEGRDLTTRQLWLIGILVFVLCFYLTHFLFNWLAFKWLVGHAGWAIVWRVGFLLMAAGAIGAFIGSLIFAPVFAAGVNMGILGAVLFPIGILVGVSSASIALMEFTPAAVLALLTLTISAAALFLAWSLPASAVLMFVFPSTMMAMCLIGWFFRLLAIVVHLRTGIAAFSLNWRETVLVSDIRHASSLLPGAGKVSRGYNCATLFNKDGEKNTYVYVGKLITSILFTFVATLYRWNIKASALIWGPIALGLSPTVWPHDPKYPDAKPVAPRTDSTAWTTKIAVVVLFTFCLYLLCWLGLTGYEYLYDDIKKEIPNWVKIAHKYLTIPQIGLRFFTASVFLVCVTWFSWIAYKMSADYYKALEDPTTYRNLTPQEYEGFLEAANAVSKWRKISQMMAVFTIYAFIFAFAVYKYPNATAFNYLHQFQNWL